MDWYIFVRIDGWQFFFDLDQGCLKKIYIKRTISAFNFDKFHFLFHGATKGNIIIR